MRFRSTWRAAQLAAGVAALLGLQGCGDADGTAGPSLGDGAKLRLAVVVTGTPIATVTAEVTAADIVTPLLFNLPITDGVATGTVKLPPGEGRTITVRAFDAGGEITHEGSATIAVRPGPNPPVQIPMIPRSGQVPIIATLAEFAVIVSPGLADVQVGASVQLFATIQDAEGHIIVSAVEWAVGNPAFASVTPDGLVTGLVEGVTTVAATFEGVAGSATVSVLPLDLSFDPTGFYVGTAVSDVQGIVHELGLVVSSEEILGCSNPCLAELILVPADPPTFTGLISVGTREFTETTFTMEQVDGVLKLTSPPMGIDFDLTFEAPPPFGTIVAPVFCSVNTSGFNLNPTPQGLHLSGSVVLACNGSGGGFTFAAFGTVVLDLVRNGG